MKEEITITQDELATAFAEWERRYQKEPQNFKSGPLSADDGMASALYLISIVKEFEALARMKQ